MNKQQCPICGVHAQEHKIKPMTFTYKNVDFIIDQPALWCDSCGEGIIDAKDNDAVMYLIQAERARIDGLLTPMEIKQARQKLKLTQKEAANIFGGGINAFSRYEHGKTPVPKPLSMLLKVLQAHPNQLKEIIMEHRSEGISKPIFQKIESNKLTPSR